MNKHHTPSGFTLIELILALTILSAVASIILTTVADVSERSRYEETEHRGEIIQAAVIGEAGETSRFVADLGRRPLITDLGDGRELAELYDDGLLTNTALRHATRRISLDPAGNRFTFGGISDFSGTKNPLGIDDIRLGVGWRGPYLRWPYSTLTDNWGRPWQINLGSDESPDWRSALDDSARIELGDEVGGIRTLGRDGIDEVDEDDTAPDTYPDEIQTYPFSGNSLSATLTIQLCTNAVTAPYERALPTNYAIRVFLYHPVCTYEAAGLCEVAAWRNLPDAKGMIYRIQTDESLEVLTSTHSTAFTTLRTSAAWGATPAAWNELTFSNLPVGIRKLWAYAYVPGDSHGLRSVLMTLELRPGGTHLINLPLTESF